MKARRIRCAETYIYQGVFAKPIAIIGEEEWGRFGFSIAHAGDLNQDGYNGEEEMIIDTLEGLS